MDLITKKLQNLTNNNSTNLLELFHSFEIKFPNEKTTIILLRDSLFSECNPIDENIVISALNKIKI